LTRVAADEFKTKTVVAFLAAVGAGKKNLILNDTADVKFVASAANIPGVKTAVDGVNTYDVAERRQADRQPGRRQET